VEAHAVPPPWQAPPALAPLRVRGAVSPPLAAAVTSHARCKGARGHPRRVALVCGHSFLTFLLLLISHFCCLLSNTLCIFFCLQR
jgi:hypothetical protein